MLVQFYLKVIRPILSKIIFSNFRKSFTDQQISQYQKELENTFNNFKRMNDIVTWNLDSTKKGFKWVSDPLNGGGDFSPEELWLFFARKGDDCDGWAEFNYQACCKIGLEPKLWAIIDGLNVGTAHVIATCYNPYDKLFYMFTNYDCKTFKTEDECINIFKTEVLVSCGTYKNLNKYLIKSRTK
jgi:hypothetical protein